MTLSEILTEVETAPDEQLKAIRLRLVAATALVDARLADIAPPEAEAPPTGDMLVDEVMADLGLKKRAQVYSLAIRSFDPLPSYNVNKRVKRFPRAGVAEWKKRQAERRG